MCGWLVRPDLAAAPPSYSPAELRAAATCSAAFSTAHGSHNLSPVRVYFGITGITIVLGVLGWTQLARVVCGKILSLREEDYAVAAQLLGANHSRILFRHLVPGFTSHIIVSLTLSVPVMILGETSLSFLGMGLRPPAVSFNFLGDGMRDAADPYSSK